MSIKPNLTINTKPADLDLLKKTIDGEKLNDDRIGDLAESHIKSLVLSNCTLSAESMYCLSRSGYISDVTFWNCTVIDGDGETHKLENERFVKQHDGVMRRYVESSNGYFGDKPKIADLMKQLDATGPEPELGTNDYDEQVEKYFKFAQELEKYTKEYFCFLQEPEHQKKLGNLSGDLLQSVKELDKLLQRKKLGDQIDPKEFKASIQAVIDRLEHIEHAVIIKANNHDAPLNLKAFLNKFSELSNEFSPTDDLLSPTTLGGDSDDDTLFEDV